MNDDQLTKLYKERDRLKKLYWLADEQRRPQVCDEHGRAQSRIEKKILAIAPTTDKTAVCKLRDVIIFAQWDADITATVERAIKAIESGVHDTQGVLALEALLPRAAMIDRATLNSFPVARILRQVIKYLSRPKMAKNGSVRKKAA